MTDYDKIKGTTTPPSAILDHFYLKYIRPYLKSAPSFLQLSYLKEQAYLAWRLEVGSNDLFNMQFVQWICSSLSESNFDDLSELLSGIFQETNDTDMKTEVAERNVYNSQSSNDQYRIFGELNRLYKVFFDNEFRLWATIPYYFLCKKYKIKNRGITPLSYVSIGAGEKFQSISNMHTTLPQGNFHDLVNGFDNEIRNAGEGHDSWEVTDKNTILFNVIDPKSGSSKGQKEFSIRQLNELIDICRKTIWILKMGIVIFMENNPEIYKKINRTKLIKISEIKRNVESFAEDRSFSLEEFSINEDRSQAKIGLKYKPRLSGEGGRAYIGREAAYDIVSLKDYIKYKHRAFGVIQFLLRYAFDEGNAPEIELKIFNEDGKSIGDAAYKSDEVEKLFHGPKQEIEPIPYRGQISEEEMTITAEFPVPYGSGQIMQKKLTEIMKKIKDGEISDSELPEML
jgi:hypothetical protein